MNPENKTLQKNTQTNIFYVFEHDEYANNAIGWFEIMTLTQLRRKKQLNEGMGCQFFHCLSSVPPFQELFLTWGHITESEK